MQGFSLSPAQGEAKVMARIPLLVSKWHSELRPVRKRKSRSCGCAGCSEELVALAAPARDGLLRWGSGTWVGGGDAPGLQSIHAGFRTGLSPFTISFASLL